MSSSSPMAFSFGSAIVLVPLLSTACGSKQSSSSVNDGGAASQDAGGDSGYSGPCPTGNAVGAVNFSGTCLAFTPTVTGASAAGENATYAHYALSPASNMNGSLVLFFNGTSAHPSDSIADPTLNFYTAATGLGYQVLAISYHSIETIANQCDCVDSCYFPSRQTVITGVYTPDASSDLTTILVDESIAGRTALALRWLSVNDSAHNWSSYLTAASANSLPETQINWAKVIVAGHSQGGGHAAAVAKLFSVQRVVQLSSSCDTVTPPTQCSHQTGDLDASTPASWLSQSNGTWQTPTALFWGLDIVTVYDGNTWVSGDGNCFLHAQIWQNEGVPSSQRNDNGGICDASTSEENHSASIDCDQNFAAWQAMFR